ncbi:MAG: PAS domain-containing protein, partial [Thermoplasmata archaeon]|nr:PAS domain-containing protein [Thermoplasmata archaeon]
MVGKSAPLTDTTPTPDSLIESVGDYRGFLQNVLDSSTEYSIIASDLHHRILLWNEGARRIYGYSAEEILGQDPRVLHAPEDVASGTVEKIFETALEQGKYEGVIRRQRKNGERFTASVVMTVLREPAGIPIGFLLVSKDITGDERLRQQLVDSEEYNRGLIESNIDALATTDTLGIITDVNRQMEETTGYPRAQLVGTPFKDYFTEPAKAEEGIRRVLAENKVTNLDLVMKSRRGGSTVVSYNATTLRGRDGKLRGVFASARDVTEQKTLEEELREAQNYTRGLIEASLDALVTVDRDGVITDLNRQTEKVTGYAREELLGSKFPEYFTDPDRALEGIRKTLDDGFIANYELVLKPRSGAERIVSFNASVFKDVAGGIKGIFASARDITAQERLQEQLRESQLYNRSLIEAAADALVVVDPELVITDVNEQMVKVTGYSRAELVGSAFKSYFEDPRRAVAGVRHTFAKGFVTNYELVLKPKDRRPVVVSLNASVFRDPEGRVKGIFASARDVTDQRALEERIRESQNYNRGLIEAAADAMVIVDTNLVITDVNEQLVRLTGHPRKQLIGSSFIAYFTEPDRAAAGVRETLDKGAVTNYEIVLRSKNNKKTPVSLSASVFRDIEGRVKGVFASSRDITAQKTLEGQLRESQNYNRGLIESSVDALLTTDAVGIVTDVNRQMEVVTGLPREKLIGTPLKNYFTRPELAEEGVRRVLEQNRLTNYELVLKSLNGEEVPVSFNATTFRGADGALKGIFASSRDVTEQKKLETELTESQNYNRSLIEASVDALVTVGPSLTITDVNEQMVKVTGYPRQELIGSLFPDYFTDPARASAGVRQTFEEGLVTNYELTLRSRHGRMAQVSFNASVFKDLEGRVKGIFASARDITEQKRLQEQLGESQLYNRGLIEASPDALVTVDPDLVITDVNEQTVKLTGLKREELLGSPFPGYFTDAERAASGVRRTLSEGSVTNYELVLNSAQGRRTLVSFNAAVFKDAEGRVAGIFAAARDITEQKR